MPDELSHPQGAARVPRGRLDPEPLERALPENPPVGDAVEGHAARETQVFHSGFTVSGPGHAQHDLLAHDLDRLGKIHLSLRQLGLGHPGRPAE